MSEAPGKLSDALLELARLVLREPLEELADELIGPAVLLASVAWNRSLIPENTWEPHDFQALVRESEARYPGCSAQLKSTNHEALVMELLAAKRARFPKDRRAVASFSFIAEGRLNVVWEPEEVWPDRMKLQALLGQHIPPGTPLDQVAPPGWRKLLTRPTRRERRRRR